MKYSVIFLIMSLSLWCSASNIQIDLSDLRPYSEELNKQEPFFGAAPYLSTFTKNKFKLSFVAAEHVEGHSNTTCKTIKDEFKRGGFKFLLVEGMPFTKINDEKQIQITQDCIASNKGCAEDTCAIEEALNKKISFNYAEPDDLTIKNSISEKGYTDRDLLFFYGLRQIPQLIRQGASDEKTVKRRLSQYLENTAKNRLFIEPLMNLDEFEKTFKDKLDRSIDYMKINADLVSPRVDENPEWSNKVSFEVGQVREHSIAKMIEQRVNEYKKVIIVYGQGHLVKERKALEKAFGQVKNTKPY